MIEQRHFDRPQLHKRHISGQQAGLRNSFGTPQIKRQTSQKVLASPVPFATPQNSNSSGRKPIQSLFTPPLSAEPFQRAVPQTMDHQQRRMSPQGQRPMMGPPETPSRGMIPQSPGLFSNIQFSPDLFTHQQIMEAQSAPIYPQQRLFWDPSTATPLQSTPQHFATPSAFPDDFNNSFNSNTTIVPQTFVTTPQGIPYDLPSSQAMDTSFIGDSVFPAPFQTSPRLAPPPIENPTQFLSSPARRFGGESRPEVSISRPLPELPAYHHQLEDSRREKEIMARQNRRRSRATRRDDDLIMNSVRRALSPRKSSRPGLTRSNTFAGLHSARKSSLSFDNISFCSSTSSRSTRNGRSSPIRHSSRRASNELITRPRASVSLAIDDNGTARTIMNSLPESDEEMIDDLSTDRSFSEDDNDNDILYSFDNRSQFDSLSRGDAREDIRSSNIHLSMDSNTTARISRTQSGSYDQSTIRRIRGSTLTSVDTNSTQAQQALKAMMQDRSNSSTVSSHASSSSMQFHSSPPMPHARLAGYSASPTTITDPDLATPSTDSGSHTSGDATRCVCNSSSSDGNIMLQW